MGDESFVAGIKTGWEKPTGQGFVQEILMFGRRYKKLSLLIDFSNTIFIKFYLKAYWC